MTVELSMLVWAVALTVVQLVITASGATMQLGLPVLAGNRQNMPELTGWASRAQRAHRNMLESLVLFAALVLTAQATGLANETTAIGAQLFFWSRLAYAVIYVAGISWLRTAVWAASVVGLVLIFLQLV